MTELTFASGFKAGSFNNKQSFAQVQRQESFNTEAGFHKEQAEEDYVVEEIKANSKEFSDKIEQMMIEFNIKRDTGIGFNPQRRSVSPMMEPFHKSKIILL